MLRKKATADKVAMLKAKGASIVAAGTPFTWLSTDQLKQVLAHYEIYPGRKPPTPYHKGKAALLARLFAVVAATGGSPPAGYSAGMTALSPSPQAPPQQSAQVEP